MCGDFVLVTFYNSSDQILEQAEIKEVQYSNMRGHAPKPPKKIRWDISGVANGIEVKAVSGESSHSAFRV